jgi:hypothetical protein
MNYPNNPFDDDKLVESYGRFLESSFISALREISKLAILLTSLIVIIIILVKHFKLNITSLDYIDFILVIGAFLIILIGVILLTLENRWKSNSKLKMIELSFNRKKFEMEFNLKLEELDFKKKDLNI